MAIRTKTPNLLDNPPIPAQAKLATAWTSHPVTWATMPLVRLNPCRAGEPLFHRLHRN